MNIGEFSTVIVPPAKLRFMGESEKGFVSTGDLLFQALKHSTVYTDKAAILDIGSGYGRLASALLRAPDFNGNYLGVDILPRHVAWCTANLTGRGKNIQFLHTDVHNSRYNPEGKLRTNDVALDVKGEYDLVCLFSVFTHMFLYDITSYLDLAIRMLRPGGQLVCTYFLMNETWQLTEKNGMSRYPMKYKLNSYTRFHSADDPLLAIAYEQEHIVMMMEERGFGISETILGSWCGRAPASKDDFFQDLIYAEKL